MTCTTFCGREQLLENSKVKLKISYKELTPVILATWAAEIEKIVDRG
jgi:hypothetical protein